MQEIKMHLNVALYVYFLSSLLLGYETCFYKVGFVCCSYAVDTCIAPYAQKILFYPKS
jgi:hypothetical protein